jgi:hypothetical protein
MMGVVVPDHTLSGKGSAFQPLVFYRETRPEPSRELFPLRCVERSIKHHCRLEPHFFCARFDGPQKPFKLLGLRVRRRFEGKMIS